MMKRKLDRAEAIKVFFKEILSKLVEKISNNYLFTKFKFSLMMYAIWLEIIELNLKFYNVYILIFIFELY